MDWKKNALLALFAATALVGVAVSASAEDWDSHDGWRSQAASQYDGDRSDYNGYYGRSYDRDHHDGDRGWNNGYRGYGSYWSNHSGERYQGWNRGYDNGYYNRNRDAYRSYGEHRDRDESDDDD